MTGVRVRESPPLGVIAPFFLAAPLGLAIAGFILMRVDDTAFLAVNIPHLVAATHATVLGWLTLAIMGAIYQLGPSVFGGHLVSLRLARYQFIVHIASVVCFIPAIYTWNTYWMAGAGVGVVISFILFLINAIPAIAWFRRGSMPRMFISVALLFLIAGASFGITYVGDLEHGWFPITQGRLSGHAHLGLVGFLALVLMGVSYQTVPMFQVVRRGAARFERPVLIITTVAASSGALIFMTDPPPLVRVGIAIALAAGPALWIADVVRMLRSRSRRMLDVHTRATVVSLAFLVAAIVVGIAAAGGEALSPGGQPARLQLAYGILAIGGWGGSTLIGSSFKIVPFLVWNARYLHLAGREPVPSIADLSSERWNHATLGLHSLAVAVLAAGALGGQLVVVHIGGLLLAGAGLSHCLALVSVVFHHPASRASDSAPMKGLTA
ncbi:MAG: hypothetical protein WBO97_03990 [Tepidiformaceae bacterium]